LIRDVPEMHDEFAAPTNEAKDLFKAPDAGKFLATFTPVQRAPPGRQGRRRRRGRTSRRSAASVHVPRGDVRPHVALLPPRQTGKRQRRQRRRRRRPLHLLRRPPVAAGAPRPRQVPRQLRRPGLRLGARGGARRRRRGGRRLHGLRGGGRRHRRGGARRARVLGGVEGAHRGGVQGRRAVLGGRVDEVPRVRRRLRVREAGEGGDRVRGEDRRGVGGGGSFWRRRHRGGHSYAAGAHGHVPEVPRRRHGLVFLVFPMQLAWELQHVRRVDFFREIRFSCLFAGLYSLCEKKKSKPGMNPHCMLIFIPWV
ncbi:hypothetical protein EE612_011384, partial [Oryza sativa]